MRVQCGTISKALDIKASAKTGIIIYSLLTSVVKGSDYTLGWASSFNSTLYAFMQPGSLIMRSCLHACLILWCVAFFLLITNSVQLLDKLLLLSESKTRTVRDKHSSYPKQERFHTKMLQILIFFREHAVGIVFLETLQINKINQISWTFAAPVQEYFEQ